MDPMKNEETVDGKATLIPGVILAVAIYYCSLVLCHDFAVPFLGTVKDGAIKDNDSGLIWLKNANCFGLRNWNDAIDAADSLADGQCDLDDGSLGTGGCPQKESGKHL